MNNKINISQLQLETNLKEDSLIPIIQDDKIKAIKSINKISNLTTISNSLDNYNGITLNDKIAAMFNDINTNHKNTPMLITLPDEVIEITQDLKAIG